MRIGGDGCLVVPHRLNLQLLSFDEGFRDFAVPFKHHLQTVSYLLLGRFHLLISSKCFVSVVLISVPLPCEFLELGPQLLEELSVLRVGNGIVIHLAQVRHDHWSVALVVEGCKSSFIFAHTPHVILNYWRLSTLRPLHFDICVHQVLHFSINLFKEPLSLHLFDVVCLRYANHRVGLFISVWEVSLRVKIHVLLAIGRKLVHIFKNLLLKVSSRVGAQGFNDECLLFVDYTNV